MILWIMFFSSFAKDLVFAHNGNAKNHVISNHIKTMLFRIRHDKSMLRNLLRKIRSLVHAGRMLSPSYLIEYKISCMLTHGWRVTAHDWRHK
jgi:hypothetical protein